MDPNPQIAFGGEFVLDRKAQRAYMARTDRHGLLFLARHTAMLVVTGTLVYLSLGSLWIVPAIVAHGFVMAFLFAPVHECSHRTPFRTRRLNEAVYWLLTFVYGVPPTFFRYSHATHHTYTQIRGRDPDMVLPRHSTVWDYIVYVSAIPFFRRNAMWFIRQTFGSVHPDQRYFLPDNELPRVFRESRIFLALYAAIAAIAIATGSAAPLIYWIIPRLVGEPFMRWFRIAEHAECPEVPDLRQNTRTTKAPGWLNLLFWNMPYHAEHHLFPKVPFHALPRLHAAVGDQTYPVGDGYFGVHGTVLDRLSHRRGVTWETAPAAEKTRSCLNGAGQRVNSPQSTQP